MKINIFEGSRRIALLIGGIWAIGVIGTFGDTWSEDTAVKMVFAVPSPGQPATRDTPESEYSECAFKDHSESRYFVTSSGTRVRAILCFKAREFRDGQMLIPYKVDSTGALWGDRRYSDNVSTYTKKVADSFRLSKQYEHWADSQLWPTRLQRFKVVVAFLFGGLIALWIFTAVVGWIVRGFLGIPRGKDLKPDSRERKTNT